MDGEGPRSALLDPLEPLPNPVGFTTPARAPTGQSTDSDTPFSVEDYAAAKGISGPTLRKKLRAAGKRAPYTLADVMTVTAAGASFPT